MTSNGYQSSNVFHLQNMSMFSKKKNQLSTLATKLRSDVTNMFILRICMQTHCSTAVCCSLSVTEKTKSMFHTQQCWNLRLMGEWIEWLACLWVRLCVWTAERQGWNLYKGDSRRGYLALREWERAWDKRGEE